MFVWPKFVLSIDSVEADVRFFVFAKGEPSYVALSIYCVPVFIFSIEAYIFTEIKMFFAQHGFHDLFIAQPPVALSLRSAQSLEQKLLTSILVISVTGTNPLRSCTNDQYQRSLTSCNTSPINISVEPVLNSASKTKVHGSAITVLVIFQEIKRRFGRYFEQQLFL